MYPTNIKVEKISKLKIVKAKITCLKNMLKEQINYLLKNRKNLTNIIIVKFHI